MTLYAKETISLFCKTSPDIEYGQFWDLRWAYGCPPDCIYCYLRGTMNDRMQPIPLKSEHVLNTANIAFERIALLALSSELSSGLICWISDYVSISLIWILKNIIFQDFMPDTTSCIMYFMVQKRYSKVFHMEGELLYE